MKKQFTIILTLATILTIGSCKKEKKEPTVYIAGTDGSEAKYWENESATVLANLAQATCIAVSDGDVYVGGQEEPSIGRYWKNGMPITLSNTAAVSGIAVANGNIYASGTDDLKRCYWKNGTEILLYDPKPTYDYDSYVNGIALLGNDALVAGYINTSGYALYWKNKTAVNLENGNGYDIGTSAVLTTSAGDVYVSGWVSLSVSVTVACYWKNGVRVNAQPGIGQDYTTSMVLSGSDVYLAGTTINSSKKQVATYWKNGVAVYLSDGTTDATVNGIAVNGSDVYAVGYVTNSNGHKIATYWRNGVATQLSDGTLNATLNAIVLVP